MYCNTYVLGRGSATAMLLRRQCGYYVLGSGTLLVVPELVLLECCYSQTVMSTYYINGTYQHSWYYTWGVLIVIDVSKAYTNNTKCTSESRNLFAVDTRKCA